MKNEKKDTAGESAYKAKLMSIIKEINSELTLKRIYALAKRLYLKEPG